MIPQLQREAPVSTAEDTTSWSLATRIAFRFVFCYFLLYVYPRSVGSLGAYVKYNNPLRDLWHVVVPWVGANILHVSGPFTEIANGSGDQIYDYVLLFCIAVVAAVATVIWSIVDRKRTNYRTLYRWLRILMRMIVAVAMISYGVNKLYRMQFAEVSLARLVDTYGQTSPMGLLWAFMGASHAYSIFGGVGEMLGGLLLIFPQFTVIGSLVTVGVMSNVLMLNLCYDVPRKIYSIHLILICLFLLLPDMIKLADLFIFNRKVQLTPPQPLFKDKQLNQAVIALQILIGVGAIFVCGAQARTDAIKNVTYVPLVRGIWSAETFTLDNVPHPPLLTDTQRWQNIIFDSPEVLTIQSMDGSQQTYYLQLDANQKKFTMWEFEKPNRHANFTFTEPVGDRMTLEGTTLDGHPMTVTLRKVDTSDPTKFLLINRGLHWVNGYPFRR